MSGFMKNVFILSDVDVRDAPTEIVVIPAGMVESTKGNFIVNENSFKAINEYYLKRELDIVIDYEHQTLNGGEAPAGGWIKSLRWEDGIGVMANVEWTEKAKSYLANREYRYLSPVILVRKSDNLAIRLHSVALTNTPAITGMTAIVNSDNLDDLERMGLEMNLLQALIELLGLPADTTEENLIQAIKELKGEMDGVLTANSDIKTLLGLTSTATVEDVKGTIIALKNPTDVVSMSEFIALKQQVDSKGAEDAVELALSEGKLLPAQKQWAVEYALSNRKGFENFIEKAPKVVPMGGDNPPPKKTVKTTLDETEMKVCKDLGITPEEYLKSKNEEE